MNEDYREQLEEFVSASDIPLFDLVSANIDAITISTNIFSDRNTADNTTAFILGIIKTIISMLLNIEVDMEDLQEFIIKQDKKDNKDD